MNGRLQELNPPLFEGAVLPRRRGVEVSPEMFMQMATACASDREVKRKGLYVRRLFGGNVLPWRADLDEQSILCYVAEPSFFGRLLVKQHWRYRAKASLRVTCPLKIYWPDEVRALARLRNNPREIGELMGLMDIPRFVAHENRLMLNGLGDDEAASVVLDAFGAAVDRTTYQGGSVLGIVYKLMSQRTSTILAEMKRKGAIGERPVSMSPGDEPLLVSMSPGDEPLLVSMSPGDEPLLVSRLSASLIDLILSGESFESASDSLGLNGFQRSAVKEELEGYLLCGNQALH